MRVNLRTFDPVKVEKLGSPNYDFIVTDADSCTIDKEFVTLECL